MRKNLASVGLASALAILGTTGMQAQVKPSVAPPVSAQTALPLSDQTSALLVNFPVPNGATRKLFSSTRQTGTWQERANYTVGGSPESAASAYSQQIVAAGWTAGSRLTSGTTATQLTLDFTKNETKAHLVVAQSPTEGTTLSITLTTIFPQNTPALSAGLMAEAASGGAASPSDRGARDPSDFPRLPGTVRSSFDSLADPSGTRETASYTASSLPANADAFYAQSLARAGWNETLRYEYVDDVKHSQTVELTWKNASRSALVSLNAAGANATTVRVILTPATGSAGTTPPPSQIHALLPSNTHGSDSGGGGNPGGTSSGTGSNSQNQGTGSQGNNPAGSQAGPVWFRCDRPNVTVRTGQYARLELQCGNAYQGNISYFTYPTTGPNSADADRLLSLAQVHAMNRLFSHYESSVALSDTRTIDIDQLTSQLWIFFDPNDMSGTSYGCLNQDCRTIMALRLIPLNLTAYTH